ncbi:MAG TPA: sigma 54-interacting transcriptional regulator [Bacillota bacterium]|nr:sigma 54-interacting transcriptional regulator [Bacillota bacterium]
MIGEEKNNKRTNPGTLDALLEASYDGIVIFDARGEILRSGGALLKKVDQQGWADIQKICLDVIHSGRRISRWVQSADAVQSFLLTASPVFGEKRRVTRVVCNLRDPEELKYLGREADCEAPRESNSSPLTEGLGYKEELEKFTTRSVAMQSVLATAIRVAQVDSTILIMGESGVGKGMLARFIQEISRRKDYPFVKISCGAIPEHLLESELFGYEAGAFTGARKQGKPGLFEVAGNGTVFLDEVAELPLSLQVKLLNVLQDKTFMRLGGVKEITTNARVIAATNKDLKQQVKKGAFRADLFYRLHVIPIVIPPLRERRGDILPLVSRFLEVFNKSYGFKRTVSPDVLDCLVRYDWPGNVRELQNVIEYLVVIARDDVIEVHDLPENILESVQKTGAVKSTSGRVTLKDALEEYERNLIASVLVEHETLKDAADSLGIDISTLTRKKQKYGLIKKL